MQHPKLFMLMLGFKPSNCHTEQHDTFFTIAENIIDTEADAKAFKPEAPKIHIDAWREVATVDGYAIRIVPKDSAPKSDDKLFFLNLGGYKEGEFDEFHYKVLAVAKDIAEAKTQATATTFFKHTKAKGAPSHVDDKYGVDVDDSYVVKDILPKHLKDLYEIAIEKTSSEVSDDIHLGYQLYEKMK